MAQGREHSLKTATLKQIVANTNRAAAALRVPQIDTQTLDAIPREITLDSLKLTGKEKNDILADIAARVIDGKEPFTTKNVNGLYRLIVTNTGLLDELEALEQYKATLEAIDSLEPDLAATWQQIAASIEAALTKLHDVMPSDDLPNIEAALMNSMNAADRGLWYTYARPALDAWNYLRLAWFSYGANVLNSTGEKEELNTPPVMLADLDAAQIIAWNNRAEDTYPAQTWRSRDAWVKPWWLIRHAIPFNLATHDEYLDRLDAADDATAAEQQAAEQRARDHLGIKTTSPVFKKRAGH